MTATSAIPRHSFGGREFYLFAGWGMPSAYSKFHREGETLDKDLND